MGDFDDGEIMIFPLTDLNANEESFDHDVSDEDDISNRNCGYGDSKFRPAMSLRQRRWSKLGVGQMGLPDSHLQPQLRLNLNINKVCVFSGIFLCTSSFELICNVMDVYLISLHNRDRSKCV